MGDRLSNRIVVLAACAVAVIGMNVQSVQAQAGQVASEVTAIANRRVTVHAENAPLRLVLENVAAQAGLTLLYRGGVVAPTTRVTLHVDRIPVSAAFAKALSGTGAAAVIVAGNRAVIAPVDEAGVAEESRSGIIAGTVVSASTNQPIRGVNILLDGAVHGVQTGDDGAYRITNVASGTHRVTARLLGYGGRTTTVIVADGETVRAEFVLALATNILDQVVVTGTIIPTELKAVPNAMTVITAKQIEERGITHIDQLFRGDVPGLFAQTKGSASLLDQVTMFSRGATAISGSSAGTDLFTNPIKTYVDGVEMADPQYLSQIDPKSIERIEILTGPQASTIYGSNAINGVMQIFTKRGTTNTPQLTLNLLSGWVENNFSNARTPQHDYSAQLNGIEGRLSYNAGGSWNYIGPWTPAKQSARRSAFGGTRFEYPTVVGRVIADMTLRLNITQNRQQGNSRQTETGYQETGWWPNRSSSGLSQPTTYSLTGQTLGTVLSYVPTLWWSHELGLGQDASDVETRVTARGYTSRSDTALSLAQSHADRRSLRYTTTARASITALAQATVTMGADTWQSLTSSWSISPQTLTGSLTGSTTVSRQPSHNTGAFFQTQLAVQDRLFLTYGLRAEWNPDYGKDAQPNMAPRYGISYTQEFGAVTAKLRGSYGRSTRPPLPTLKVAETIADVYGSSWSDVASFFLPYYGGIFTYILANPQLGPEHQQGSEGGLELYLGTHGSLIVTHYNQTVNGLIVSPAVDSIRSLVLCQGFACANDSYDAAGFGYYHVYQYLNIGSLRNQGWELQGSVNTGSFTTHGTYSWTKSRTIGIDAKYRTQFPANFYPQYQPGATFQYLPEHTWAFGIMYARATSSFDLNVTGTGRIPNEQNAFFWHSLYGGIRLSQNRLNMGGGTGYVSSNAGYALVDLNMSHRLMSRVEGVLHVQNLANRYTNDLAAAYAVIGRQGRAGFRVRL